jgi:hypothetical protein
LECGNFAAALDTLERAGPDAALDIMDCGACDTAFYCRLSFRTRKKQSLIVLTEVRNL